MISYTFCSQPKKNTRQLTIGMIDVKNDVVDND
jgi:hypothetical protein